MNNDVNYVNYTRRSLRDETIVTLELFGSPIDCVDAMTRINDIQKAYYIESGNDKRIQNWMRLQSTKDLIEYLSSDEVGFYVNSNEVVNTSKVNHSHLSDHYQGTFVCRELAHDFAMWLDRRYAAHVLRAFDQLVQGNFEVARKTATRVARPFIKLAWKYEGDENASVSVVEHFRDDPDFSKFTDIIKDYNENNY